MNKRNYHLLRAAALLFIITIVVVALWLKLYLLAVVGVLTAIIFLMTVQSQAKLAIDEREQSIREKAAHTTYAIFAPNCRNLCIAAFNSFSRRRFSSI